jgi:hypothetical protein
MEAVPRRRRRCFNAKMTITTPVLLPDPGVVEFTLTGLRPELTRCRLVIGAACVELLPDHLAAWRSRPAEALAGELKASFELISPVKPGLHSLSLVSVRSPDGSQEIAGQKRPWASSILPGFTGPSCWAGN